MTRLLLLRHAKAVPGDAKTGDHSRGLSERGHADAPLMGAAMHHKGYRPGLVLCSTALRTLETWQHIGPELGGEPAVQFLDSLYLASGKTIAALVRAIASPADTVLVIGHNPGLEDCARAFARKPRTDAERKRYEIMSEKFPTAALAVLDFDAQSWASVETGKAELADFLRPKALSAG